ncbi:MAG: type VI secretion system-associated FHA domain protein [Burkholderiales bacterium]
MISIRVVSHRGRPPANPLEVRLDETGGTIGRLESNQLVLPDPERHISRVHARILHRPDGYFILHQGSNPILLNDATLRIGDQAPLTDGDELAVSTYRLRVSLQAVPDRAEPAELPHGSNPPLAGAPERLQDSVPATVVTRAAGNRLDETNSRFVSPSGASLEAAPIPSSAHGASTSQVEMPPAPLGPVDFDLDAPAAAVADTPDSPAEVYLSWETDVANYRMPPGAPRPSGNRASDAPSPAAKGDHARGSGSVEAPLPAIAESPGEPECRDDMRAASSDLPSRQPVLSDPVLQAFLSGAGTRAALEGALRRFSPEHLEQRLKHRTLLDSVLSINRKAKLWDLFSSVYAEIAQETQEDIRKALAREFLMIRRQRAQPPNDEDESQS